VAGGPRQAGGPVGADGRAAARAHAGHDGGHAESPIEPDARPWVEELPVDSWGRPFVAAVYDADGQSSPTSVSPSDIIPNTAGRAYPMSPPPGTTIVVVSAGRDGILQSNLDALAHGPEAQFRGDDTGQVLQGRGAGS
jgi:hypothetical protein